MELTRNDLRVIHERLLDGARRDQARAARRVRVTAGVAAAALALTGTSAAAVGLGWVDVGTLRVSPTATLPAKLQGVPAALLLANDPNAEACGDGSGWVAATAVAQSPHAPGTTGYCHSPTQAERKAYLAWMVASDPQRAQPFDHWYRLDPASIAATEGRPGAATALGAVYVGSLTPLKPAQVADPRNWRVTVSGVGGPPATTALPLTTPIPNVAHHAGDGLPGSSRCPYTLRHSPRHNLIITPGHC